MTPSKKLLLDTLVNMPEESFGYVVIACGQVAKQYVGNHGFRPESTESFVMLDRAVNNYIEQGGK